MSQPATSALTDVSKVGAFVRKDSVFRNRITAGGKYPPASGRYTLYVSYACPWASRCVAFRHALGLDAAIALAVVSPIWQRTRPELDEHEGWAFDASYPGATADPLGHKFARDLYEVSMRNSGEIFETRYTVPILWDNDTNTIVCNESSEIIRDFQFAFAEFATKQPRVDLVPTALIPEIDRVNEWTYNSVCNGVYRCGFAQSQAAYDEAVDGLFARLDEIEALLGRQRFLVAGSGAAPTEADVRLFVTLVRFDAVYFVHFKTSLKSIKFDYAANINQWMRDVYQTLDLAPTVNLQHIKDHYYRSHPSINRYGVVPRTLDTTAELLLPHDRAAKFAAAAA